MHALDFTDLGSNILFITNIKRVSLKSKIENSKMYFVRICVFRHALALKEGGGVRGWGNLGVEREMQEGGGRGTWKGNVEVGGGRGR